MPLEDDFTDIIKKARNGQGLSVEDVAGRSGLNADQLAELERGKRQPSAGEVEAIAKALGLRAGPLTDIALGSWVPEKTPDSVTEVDTIYGDIGGYEVKGYILYDSAAKEAILIDTGYNAQAALSRLDQHGLRLKAVCLTHGHTDHAGKLGPILARWPVPVYLGCDDMELAPWLPSKEFLSEPADGQGVQAGRLGLEFMATPGHTPGGICYRVKSAANEMCFVGDTLFAGSVGRSNPFSLYPGHLESVRKRVLTLPAGTVLFPGHGPATTVAEEIRHNPFAAER